METNRNSFMREKPPEGIQKLVDKWKHVLNATEPLSGWPKVLLIEPQETTYILPKQNDNQ
ncbi:MAG: hypothetical protein QN632_02400 [Nitrososphaeraceae archaeon]|nr:hypothetical protein [Nitrososphaeraceae archaeon]